MKKFIFFIIVLSLSMKASILTAYSSDPKLFVEELVSDALNKLSNKSLTYEEKASFVESIALENVDINALGLYTLGEIRKTTSKEDLTRFQKTFEKYFYLIVWII